MATVHDRSKRVVLRAVLSAGLEAPALRQPKMADATMTGVRLLKALNFLRQQGFKYLKSVKGGTTAWSEEIDAKVPQYCTMNETLALISDDGTSVTLSASSRLGRLSQQE